jgi:hypothetical protein
MLAVARAKSPGIVTFHLSALQAQGCGSRRARRSGDQPPGEAAGAGDGAAEQLWCGAVHIGLASGVLHRLGYTGAWHGDPRPVRAPLLQDVLLGDITASCSSQSSNSTFGCRGARHGEQSGASVRAAAERRRARPCCSECLRSPHAAAASPSQTSASRQVGAVC